MTKELDLSNFKHILPVPRQIGDKVVDLIDARPFHECLGNRTRFRDWIRRRIETYGFKEKDQYYKFQVTRPVGGFRLEYYITQDMAIHLAALEETERGMQVRQALIDSTRARQQELALSHSDIQLVKNVTAHLEKVVLDALSPHAELTALMHDDVKETKDNVRDLWDAEKAKRRDLSKEDKSTHCAVVKEYFSCKCPICRLIHIVDQAGQKLTALEFHHWYKPSMARVKETMPMCADCHLVFTTSDAVYSQAMSHHFTTYQEYINLHLGPPQQDLFE